MGIPSLIIHERLAHWARQLAPRLAAWPVRLVETRSADDLRPPASAACPSSSSTWASASGRASSDLDRAARAAPNGLILVLDRRRTRGRLLARELGATP